MFLHRLLSGFVLGLAVCSASLASAEPLNLLNFMERISPVVPPSQPPRPVATAPASASPLARVVVNYQTSRAPGDIIINTSERRLYYVLEGGQAIRYAIGVGRDGFRWSGVEVVSAKKEWPSWTPPDAMIRRQPWLPRHMAGGPNNPLGARALYLGSTEYRIHGSNEPHSIGSAVSSGCFRMLNEDVIDLYKRVEIGATVVVLK